MTDEYSVVLFFPDGSYHYEQRWLSDEAAVRLAAQCANRPAALAGFIERIVVIDDGDCICLSGSTARA
jgi:hypothetical protein